MFGLCNEVDVTSRRDPCSLPVAGRLVTRPGTLWSQLQRRFIHPSRSQLQAPALPRPNTWLGNFRFRADGKPRSKLIALGIGEYPF